jgi:pilus assembly protein HofN
VLESLSRAIPSQVWLTELRYQPPALMLTGYASPCRPSALRDALAK